jgi:hypothetical protein
MKKLLYPLMGIVFFVTCLIVLIDWYAGNDLKTDKQEREERIELNNKRQNYLNKIKTISFFGIHFQDDVRKLAFYSSQEVTDRYGLYVGDQSDADIPALIRYSIEIIPPNKNENFIKYYAFYNPFSYEIFSIVGVLPKKFSDFLDEEDKNLDSYSLTNLDYSKQDKAFNRCKEYIEPFISIINDGIKSKSNLVADDESFKEKHKSQRGFSMIYRMNSGLNEGYNFDGFPEKYYGINPKKYITKRNHREPIIRLEASCKNYSDDPNISILLSHDILRGYMITDLDMLFRKKVSEKKLKEEQELLKYKKKSIDKSGLQ